MLGSALLGAAVSAILVVARKVTPEVDSALSSPVFCRTQAAHCVIKRTRQLLARTRSLQFAGNFADSWETDVTWVRAFEIAGARIAHRRLGFVVYTDWLTLQRQSPPKAFGGPSLCANFEAFAKSTLRYAEKKTQA